MNTTRNDQQFVSLDASELSNVVGGQAAQYPVDGSGPMSPSTPSVAPSTVPSPIPPGAMDPTQQYSAQQYSADPAQQSSVDPTQQYFQGASTGTTSCRKHHHKHGRCDD